MHKLVIEDEEGRTTVVPLLRDEITVGRKDGNTIRLTERNVSRRHARFVRQNGAFHIEDLDSYNGIRINGVRIQGRAQLREGDRIQIGDYLLALRAEGSDVVAANADTMVDGPIRSTTADTDPDRTDADRKLPSEMLALQKAAALAVTAPMEPVTEPGTPAVAVAPSATTATVAAAAPAAPAPWTVPAPPPDEAPSAFEARPVIAAASMPTMAAAPGRGRVVWVVGGIGALAVAGFVAWRGLQTGEPAVAETAAPPPGDHQPAVTPPPPPAPVAQPAWIADVESAAQAEDWDKVIEICNGVLAREPGNAVCTDRKARAETDRTAKPAWVAFQDAVAKKDYQGAIARWSETKGSQYEARGQSQYLEVRGAYVTELLSGLEKAAKDGRCDEARRLRDRIHAVDAQNARAPEIADSCKARPAAPVVAAGPASAPEPAPTFDPEKLEELLTLAESAYVSGEHSLAIETARKALKMQSSNSKAWRIIGVSSCYLKDHDIALDAYKRLQENNRQLLQYVCQRNGVTLP